MKKLLILFCLLAVSAVKAQAPQFLNYQGVARNSSGTIITSAIGIKFEILQGSATGTLIYDETNTITPSSAGIFTTAIGSGAPGTGTFSAINWANSPYFVRVSIDPAGGTSYSTVGTSQLLSVPYALYAESTKPSTLSLSGNSLSINNGNSITLPAGTSYTSGPGISITGNTITNTAPSPTLTAAGISSITGTHPSFTIDVPPPALNYNTGTNVLTLTQGTAVATTTLSGTGSGTINMFATGIASVSPVGAGSNFTVSVQSPTLTGAGSTTVTGTYPNFLISTPSATASVPGPPNIVVNPPHATTTLSPGNYSITVQPTNITGTGVTGTYPNYTVNSTAPTSITPGGSNVIVNGTGPSFTISAATPTLQINPPNSIIPLGLNNYSINVQPTTLTGAGAATVSGSHPNYTVGVPTTSISASGNTITVTQGTAVTSATVSSGPWATTGTVIHPAGNPTNDKVAIGQTSANSMLHVGLNPGATNTLNPVATIINQNASLTSSVLRVENNNASVPGLVVDNNGPSGDGAQVNITGVSNNGTALQVNHNGNGYAGYFANNNTSNNSRLLYLNQAGIGGLLYGSMTNTASSVDVVNIFAGGSGNGFYLSKFGTGYGVSVNHGGTSGGAGYFNSTSATNPAQALTVQNAGTSDALGVYNTGMGRAVYGTNTNSLETAYFSNSGSGRGLWVANISNSEAAYLSNTGNAPALVAYNTGSIEAVNINASGNARGMIMTNNSGTSETALFINSGNGRGLIVQNPNASPNRAAQIFGGLDIIGKTAGSSTFAVVVTNSSAQNLFNIRDDGNIGINVPNPGFKLQVIDGSSVNTALFASQTSAVSSGNAHGIYGLTSNPSPFASGVRGENTGAGPGVYGNKTSGTGPAGRFDIGTTTNNADAVLASTNGQGAAIHAINGPTVAGSSNAAVWLESGHLKSTQSVAPTTSTVSVSGGGISSATITLAAGSTDVKGRLLAVITTSGMINAGNSFAVRVNFNKSYTVAPVVVVVPSSDNALLNPFVSAVSPTSFTVTIKNGSAGNMTAISPFSINLNYMVIE